ncbi:hypothetical protein [Luteimonas deserti]|uniref:Uncharacterized protein n=1 Tax=Luteimonas deserti TaxID=2752306 RepID=A0A7Z0U0E5_9GAMM|nr:hypothetical protein [Luteimonas deserti]NYZ63203.1 hypothetical protein [Luteimonas deserti]
MDAPVSGAPLPAVRHALPWGARFLFIASGASLALLPLHELGPAAWPLGWASLPAGSIIVVAGGIGTLLVLAGVLGEARTWAYPARALVIERRLWGRSWETRLAADDVADVAVEHVVNSEGPDVWRVVVVPRSAMTGPGRQARRRATYRSHGFATRADAQAARRALIRHLGLRLEPETDGDRGAS